MQLHTEWLPSYAVLGVSRRCQIRREYYRLRQLQAVALSTKVGPGKRLSARFCGTKSPFPRQELVF
jgi:hypothetical protein